MTLWARNHDHAKEMVDQKKNEKYLSGVVFPSHLQVTSDLKKALDGCQDILLVVPSQAFSETLHQIQPLLHSTPRLLWACKGIEPGSGQFFHQCVEEKLGSLPMAVLSGPTFAIDLAKGMPTAITLASNNEQFAEDLSLRFVNSRFRVYTSDDMIGVQLGGAFKNIIAIAAGIADGLQFGANARIALVTRGLAEIQRLGLKLGGKTETFQGLAGLGDLFLTSTDNQSRNRRFGLAIGRGESVEAAIQQIGQVVEGVKNVPQALALSKRYQVDMPITEAIYKIIYEDANPLEQAQILLNRTLKAEGE